MLLVDTCVWIAHLRVGEPALVSALQDQQVACHPHVLGELALGRLKNRGTVLSLLRGLPRAPVASDAEVFGMIETRALMGRGVGYVDAHLLASALLQPGLRLWTFDKRLHAVAASFGVAVEGVDST